MAPAFPILYAVVHTQGYNHTHTHYWCLDLLFSVCCNSVELVQSEWRFLVCLGIGGYGPQACAVGTQTCQHSLSPETKDGWPGATFCPELCAHCDTPAPLLSLSQTHLLSRPIVGSLMQQTLEPSISCYDGFYSRKGEGTVMRTNQMLLIFSCLHGCSP